MKTSLTVWGHFHAAHRLMNHIGKCKRLHGHDWKVRVMFHGDVNPNTGMLRDFAVLKRVVNDIMGIYDHRTILHGEDPLAKFLETNKLFANWLWIIDEHPTAEVLAQRIYSKLVEAIHGDKSLMVLCVEVFETDENSAKVSG